MLLYVALVVGCFTRLADLTADDTVDFHKNLPALVVWGALGEDVELPCDATPPTPSESVAMVLWFRGASGVPLYSLDARAGGGTHWAISSGLGSRSFLVAPTSDNPSAPLRIRKLETEDQGVFRCRVDFFSHPTRNSRVNLTLVEPPSQPSIFDAHGREVGAVAGPFLEGYDLFLSCQVSGGRPPPTVSWVQEDGTSLAGIARAGATPQTALNQLVIAQTPRSMAGTRLACRAQPPRGPALSREVTVSVYLRPQRVRIITDGITTLSVLRPHQLRCETNGSHPPADVTWLLDGQTISRNLTVTTQSGNTTVSAVTLQVGIADDGKELVCRASNPRLPGSMLEDRRVVRVAYPPAVYVVAAPGADPAGVQEGADIQLTCEAHANPPPHAYSWYHDERLIAYDEVAGTLPDGATLRLRNVIANSAGEYRCAAANSEGETRSVAFRLRILYAPRCSGGITAQPVVWGGSGGGLTARCEVDAAPAAAVRFSWTYARGGDVLPVPRAARVSSTGLRSTLHLPASAAAAAAPDTLACWASNSVGNQQVPCYFHVVPAKAPNPPEQCEARPGIVDGVVEVACRPGEDGGLHQHFQLELVDISQSPATLNDQATHATPPTSGSTVSETQRIVGEEPVFHLRQLEPGREYSARIHAVNAHGRSQPAVVLALRPAQAALKPPPPRYATRVPPPPDTLDGSSESQITADKQRLVLMAAVALGVAGVVSITAIATAIACCRRRSTAQAPSVTSSPKDVAAVTASASADPMQPMHTDDAGFGLNFQRRSAEWGAQQAARSAGIECGVPISRRISQHIAVDHPDLIMH